MGDGGGLDKRASVGKVLALSPIRACTAPRIVALAILLLLLLLLPARHDTSKKRYHMHL